MGETGFSKRSHAYISHVKLFPRLHTNRHQQKYQEITYTVFWKAIDFIFYIFLLVVNIFLQWPVYRVVDYIYIFPHHELPSRSIIHACIPNVYYGP